MNRCVVLYMCRKIWELIAMIAIVSIFGLAIAGIFRLLGILVDWSTQFIPRHIVGIGILGLIGLAIIAAIVMSLKQLYEEAKLDCDRRSR